MLRVHSFSFIAWQKPPRNSLIMETIWAHLLTEVNTPLMCILMHLILCITSFHSRETPPSVSDIRRQFSFIKIFVSKRKRMKFHFVCKHLCDRERFRNNFRHLNIVFYFRQLRRFESVFVNDDSERERKSGDSRLNLIPSRRDLGEEMTCVQEKHN